MRRMVLLVSIVCLCSGLFSAVSAQRQKVQTKSSQTTTKAKPPQKKANQTTVEPSTELPASDAGGDQTLRVRVDGLYHANVGSDPADPTYQYFRFFSDSTGVGMCCTSGKPAEVAKWLNKDHQRAQEGTYRLEGATLVFIVGDERGAHTKYSGTLTREGWTLNPQGPNTTKFMFVPVAFPKEMIRPGQNRPPKIAPVISKMDAFDYDAAGRVVGVTTTIEIKASDPDGDSLTYTWTATVGSITGDGPKCVWKRPIVMGQPGPGVVTVVVTDGKGGRISREFVF